MDQHSITAGDLVTSKASTWVFTLGEDPSLPPGATIAWSYGTPFQRDTVSDPADPVRWIPCGSTLTSDPVRFTLAAPYKVRVRIAVPISGGEEEGGGGEGGGVRLDPGGLPGPGVERATGGDGLIPPRSRSTTGGTDLGPLSRPVGPSSTDLGTVERPGRTTSPPVGPVGPVEVGLKVLLQEYEITVFPGVLVPIKGPEFLAQSTLGYLPLLFQLKGMGSKVKITSPIRYRIRRPDRPGSEGVGEDDARFTRAADAGNADSFTVCQENGGGATYIMYLAPAAIRRLGRVGTRAALRGPLPVEFGTAARPMSADPPGQVSLGATYTDIVQYVDERPELLHMTTAFGAFTVLPMGGDPTREQAGETFIEKRTPNGRATSYRGSQVPGDLEADGEVIAASNDVTDTRAAPAGFRTGREGFPQTSDELSLRAYIRDRVGIWGRNYNFVRIEGELRANGAVVYYPLETRSLPDVLDGPRCLIERNEGTLKMRLFPGNEEASVTVTGLKEANLSVDYYGVLAAILGLTQGTAAAAGSAAAARVARLSTLAVSTTLKRVALLANPWVGVLLTLGTAIANVLWANNIAKLPYSSAELAVGSALTLHGAEGDLKTFAGTPLTSSVSSWTKETGGRLKTIDVSLSASDSVIVGDLVRVEQIYSAMSSQKADESLETYASIYHNGFRKALNLKVVYG